MRPRVQIISPFRASDAHSRADNISMAVRLSRLAIRAGFAPFASHLLYPGFLDDGKAEERLAGIECSEAWIAAAESVWVFDGWGISTGMAAEIAVAEQAEIPIVYFSKGEVTAWQGVEEGLAP